MSGTVEQIRSPLGRLDICCVAAAMIALPLSRGMSGVTEPRARLFNVHWRPEKPAVPLLKLYGHTLREESNGPLNCSLEIQVLSPNGAGNPKRGGSSKIGRGFLPGAFDLKHGYRRRSTRVAACSQGRS